MACWFILKERIEAYLNSIKKDDDSTDKGQTPTSKGPKAVTIEKEPQTVDAEPVQSQVVEEPLEEPMEAKYDEY